MENSIEAIVEQERKKGWFVTLKAGKEGWTCMMECSVEVLEARMPRPICGGPTAMAALVIAIRERDKRYGRQKMVAA